MSGVEFAPATTRACCVRAYESEWARLLLGDSLHPGGIPLTLALGEELGLGSESLVLDVACGRGTSAVALAERFACTVYAVDLSRATVAEGCELSRAHPPGRRVRFAASDAERLPFRDESFDAVICECAFCTFPGKAAAAAELARVLRPGGRVGLSDVTREGALPPELDSLLGWVACLADARPLDEYARLLASAGFEHLSTSLHDGLLERMASHARLRLLVVEAMVRAGKRDLPMSELLTAKRLARAALESVRGGILGYGMIVGSRPQRVGRCST